MRAIEATGAPQSNDAEFGEEKPGDVQDRQLWNARIVLVFRSK